MAKELTDLQKRFLDELFKPENKGEWRKAMKAAGYTSLSRYMDLVKSLRQEIIEMAETYVALNAPKAAMETVGVLEKPTSLGARNTIAAAKEIMDRAGLVKIDKTKIEVDTSKGMLFILPAKDEPNE